MVQQRPGVCVNIEHLCKGGLFQGCHQSCLLVTRLELTLKFNQISSKQTQQSQDEANTAEPALKKFKGVKITPGMNAQEVNKIKNERLERKRANSRRWHAKFESKGVPLISVLSSKLSSFKWNVLLHKFSC